MRLPAHSRHMSPVNRLSTATRSCRISLSATTRLTGKSIADGLSARWPPTVSTGAWLRPGRGRGPVGYATDQRRGLSATPPTRGAVCRLRHRQEARSVGYAIDRRRGLSATPPTSPIRIGGVADRWRSGSLACPTASRGAKPSIRRRASAHSPHRHHAQQAGRLRGIACAQGRGLPPTAHDDVRGRKQLPPTAHNRGPRPGRIANILHLRPAMRSRPTRTPRPEPSQAKPASRLLTS